MPEGIVEQKIAKGAETYYARREFEQKQTKVAKVKEEA
jgi:hypothetical protein